MSVEIAPGFSIIAEGQDFSGKSTHVKYIEQQIREKYLRETVLTREPGGTPAAEYLRNFILSKTEEHFPVDAEILLFNAARVFHLENKIKPAIADGKVVVCDRFSDSTFAYQCAHGASYDRIKELNDWTLKGFVPDYTFFFMISPEVAKERAAKRGVENRFDEDSMATEFSQKMMSTFWRRHNESESKYFIIDSSKSIENTQQQIDLILEQIFKLQ